MQCLDSRMLARWWNINAATIKRSTPARVKVVVIGERLVFMHSP